jgi:hypothetical protein
MREQGRDKEVEFVPFFPAVSPGNRVHLLSSGAIFRDSRRDFLSPQPHECLGHQYTVTRFISITAITAGYILSKKTDLRRYFIVLSFLDRG